MRDFKDSKLIFEILMETKKKIASNICLVHRWKNKHILPLD